MKCKNCEKLMEALVKKEITICNMRDRLIELGDDEKSISYLEKVQ